MKALPRATMGVVLGRRHVWKPATGGTISCAACGLMLDEGWRAEVEPCIDEEPTGVSDAEAMERSRAALAALFRGLYESGATDE